MHGKFLGLFITFIKNHYFFFLAGPFYHLKCKTFGKLCCKTAEECQFFFYFLFFNQQVYMAFGRPRKIRKKCVCYPTKNPSNTIDRVPFKSLPNLP